MRRNIALYINGQQADLEKDSIIQFNYTMEDLTDPAIVKNSYSQQVTLPSTPRNNKIFGHISNADRATSTGFNALVRTPFVITEDGNVIETGYLKLDSIEQKGASRTYKVSLYGGLGSFFYNLSYTEGGESLTLADLDYLGGEKLDFRIYRTTVLQAWDELANGGAYARTRWQILNFAPAYNGIPSDDFDADKALCDPALTVYPPSFTDDDGEEWVASNFIEMSKEYNEWQVKDLRSYMQRPVMRMRSVIEACSDPEQNGGYTVTLDPIFFNDANPYYNKAWFSLPILRTLELASEDGEETVTYDGGFSKSAERGVMAINYKANIEGATASITVNVAHVLRASVNFPEGKILRLGYKTGDAVTTTYITYTLRALDINGNIIFTSSVPKDCVYQWSESQNVGVGNSCEVTIENMTNVAAIELAAEIGGYDNGIGIYDGNTLVSSDYYLSFYPLAGATNTLTYSSAQSARSGSLITQDALLRTKNTPADYLLSYCKTFGLHFLYDKVNKSISIVTRNTLYDVGQTLDINKKIDRSKAITITPYVLESKWYDFVHTNEEGDFAKYYKTIYGMQYGAQVVNTGFDFNAEHKEVLSSVLFQGACQVSERSKYYNTISHPHGQEVLEASDAVLYDAEAELIYVVGDRRYYPSILLDASHKGQYVDEEGNTQEKTIATVPYYAEIEYYDPTYKSYDAYSKVQFHDNEDGPIELRDVLLFYDGTAEANVSITDDTAKMLSENEGTPCWILTVPATPMQIARFVRFNDTHSFDFGTPREIDIPNVAYPSSGTIYARGWQAYIADRYDVDTKVVRCFVDLRGVQVNENLLRNFYVFDNALWVLNKITNYTMTSYTTTECEFVKVKDKNNYIIGQKYN